MLAVSDWYLVVPTMDLTETPKDSWQLGWRSIATGGEIEFQSYIGVGPTSIGLTPFVNSYFCTKWKILSKRRIVLQPGQTKEFH